MEVVDIMYDDKYGNLQENLEEYVEDDDRVFEEETLIPIEQIERENIMYVKDEDEE